MLTANSQQTSSDTSPFFDDGNDELNERSVNIVELIGNVFGGSERLADEIASGILVDFADLFVLDRFPYENLLGTLIHRIPHMFLRYQRDRDQFRQECAVADALEQLAIVGRKVHETITSGEAPSVELAALPSTSSGNYWTNRIRSLVDFLPVDVRSMDDDERLLLRRETYNKMLMYLINCDLRCAQMLRQTSISAQIAAVLWTCRACTNAATVAALKLCTLFGARPLDVYDYLSAVVPPSGLAVFDRIGTLHEVFNDFAEARSGIGMAGDSPRLHRIELRDSLFRTFCQLTIGQTAPSGSLLAEAKKKWKRSGEEEEGMDESI